VLDQLIVKPGKPASLAARDPGDKLGLASREEAEPGRQRLLEELAAFQDRLWAEAARGVLLVLQGVDTSGKDGTIRHVFTGLNPAGVADAAFKVPAGAELEHDYLWRVHAVCPGKGEIGIFNRSHYEDIVTVRIRELQPKAVWSKRYRHVREFERMLTDEGTAIVKVFLHISKEEQRRRLQARLDEPDKRWKFKLGDLDSRALWGSLMEAYEEALTETSTDWAPWHVIPADHKWVRNVAVSHLLVETLRKLDPRFPDPKEDLSGVVVS
jgi:PPK2 family polyphosphate:nucleotide phosphotransferase